MASSISQFTSSGQQRSPASQAQRTEEAKDAFTASLNDAGSTIDADLQSRAKAIHANADNLKKQDKNVQKEMKQLSKESDALDKFLKKNEKNMPQTDSFEDEIAKIEADLDMLDDTLREAEAEDQSADEGPSTKPT